MKSSISVISGQTFLCFKHVHVMTFTLAVVTPWYLDIYWSCVGSDLDSLTPTAVDKHKHQRRFPADLYHPVHTHMHMDWIWMHVPEIWYLLLSHSNWPCWLQLFYCKTFNSTFTFFFMFYGHSYHVKANTWVVTVLRLWRVLQMCVAPCCCYTLVVPALQTSAKRPPQMFRGQATARWPQCWSVRIKTPHSCSQGLKYAM